MCAWVYRRKAKWYVAYRNEAGRLVRKSTSARFKHAAEKLATELESEAELVRLGLKRRHQVYTWDQLCTKWEADVLPNLRAQHTRAGELRRVLRPAFAGRALHDIAPGEVDAWLTSLRKQGLADSTRWLYRTRLSGLFAMAVRMGWLASNPVKAAAKVKVAQRAPAYLTEEEVRKVLEVAPDYFRPILATAFYCGLRRGELAGLKWEDVDFEAGAIHIRRSFQGPTKGGREEVVPLPRALVPYLREARLVRRSDWCFPALGGRPRKKGWPASLAFSKVLKAAGVARPLTFHATRHTWATHFYAATRDLRLTQRLARHTSARTTEKYAHLVAESVAAQVNKLSYGDMLPRKHTLLHTSDTRGQTEAARARKRRTKTRR